MAYTKIVFQNSPSTATPLNAENLNHMDDQIALNDQRLTEIQTSYVKSFNGRKGEVVPEDGDYNIGQIAPLTGAQVGQVPVVVNHGTEQDPELVFEMGAGGGGGHSIIDSEGNTMPQEDAMQFADSHVSDDLTNGKTIVENIKEHTTKADYDNATEDGFHVIDDGNDVPIGEIEEDYVEVTANGVKTYGQLFNELYEEIDATKINAGTYLFFADSIWKLEVPTSNVLYFHREFQASASNIYAGYIMLSSASEMWSWEIKTTGNTTTTATSDKPSDGTVISLHYGTSSGIVELNTDARHCMMSDGQSVESAIVPSGYSTDGLTFTDCTLVNGGYFKIGKMVVLNIRVKVTASSSVTKAYIDLPNKITPSTTLIGLTAQQSTDDLPPIFSVISIGKIFMKNTTDNKDYVISGAWLA